MSHFYYLVFAAVFGVAASKPADFTVPNKLDLSSVLNKTLCPVKIDYDVQEDRIPKRIKVLKCEDDPYQWCSKMHIPKNECCQHQHDNVRMSCVEVQDIVQVYYPKEDVKQLYRVSVGCACVMEETPRGADAEPAR